MGTWILILTVGLSQGVAVTSIEFNSRENCENAKKEVVELNNKGFSISYGVCVEKGEFYYE